MKFLLKMNPIAVSCLVTLTIGLKILQWFVINVDDGFLPNHIVLPFINIFNQGIYSLVICRLVQDSIIENFRMIEYWITSLHQY
jgi:hypothetical protein